ncbi:MAG: TlpA disulfide reductase family protein [Bryobacteraceae bacterium]|jgi:peroxiredoxin
MRTLFPFLLCAAALLAGDQAGRRAPGFALFDSNMKYYDLADYRGKVVILEFMQTDCAHCTQFAGVLNQVQKQYGDKVQILAVVFAGHDDAAKVDRYAAAHDIMYPILFDQGQMEYSYVRKSTVENPYVFLIDGNGVVRNDFEYGLLTKNIFEGKGLFTEIDRVLNSNASVAPKK